VVGGGRATFGEKYGYGFVDVHLKFPFSEVSMESRQSVGEPPDYGIGSPRLG
jgi:hypothetical protein